jgi:hypothetical protein
MVGDIKRKAEKDVKLYQENALGDSNELQGKLTQEKRQLQTAHQDELNKVMKSEIEKRNLLKDKALQDVRLMREQQETEAMRQRERQKQKFADLNKASEIRNRTLANNMREELDRVNAKTKIEQKRNNKEFGKTL